MSRRPSLWYSTKTRPVGTFGTRTDPSGPEEGFGVEEEGVPLGGTEERETGDGSDTLDSESVTVVVVTGLVDLRRESVTVSL